MFSDVIIVVPTAPSSGRMPHLPFLPSCLLAAAHSQGAPQAQVHHQTLQEDVLPQRADRQVSQVEGGRPQRQQLRRFRRVGRASRVPILTRA